MPKEISAKIHRDTFAIFDLGVYEQRLFLVVQWDSLPRQLFYLGFLWFAENASGEDDPVTITFKPTAERVL
jgi:hypothetical protein